MPSPIILFLLFSSLLAQQIVFSIDLDHFDSKTLLRHLNNHLRNNSEEWNPPRLDPNSLKILRYGFKPRYLQRIFYSFSG
jgi:hypothetical protein